MPFYDYRCESCGHELETMQKISDPPLVECPACEQPTLKKQLSAPQFRLKGGGWYETDFKSGKKKNLHGEEGAESKPKSDKPQTDKAKTGAKDGVSAKKAPNKAVEST